MAEIRPFKGMRFTEKAGNIQELVCPPYDIVSEEERLGFLATNPHNVIRLELPRDGENPYVTAGEVLKDWMDNGILALDEKPAIYIYEEEFDAHGTRKKVKGIISLVKLEEFSKGIVLPHEETLSKAKVDRFNLMSTTFCNFSQIYSLYNDNGAVTSQRVSKLSDRPADIELTGAENIIHRLWIVDDETALAELVEDFKERKLYIADGHHRYETALNFRNALRENGNAPEGTNPDYVMMMLVDMENEGLVVLPTHRLVRDLENYDPEEILGKCEEFFDVSAQNNVSDMEAVLDGLYQDGKKAFGFYGGGEGWTLLVRKDDDAMAQMLPDKSTASQNLDVSVLHTLVLDRIMGIDKENMANQINLTYTKYFDEAINGVKDGTFQCTFILNPTRVEEIRDVAAAGEKMPQKSTYFYPKLITGLVMNNMMA